MKYWFAEGSGDVSLSDASPTYQEQPHRLPQFPSTASAAMGQRRLNSLGFASYEQNDDNNACGTGLVLGPAILLMRFIHNYFCPLKAGQGFLQTSGMCRLLGLNELLR